MNTTEAAETARLLWSLLHAAGQANGIKVESIKDLSRLPIFQHLASVLSTENNYIDPADAELASASEKYDDPSGQEELDNKLEHLLELRRTDQAHFLRVVEDPHLQALVESLYVSEEECRQQDAWLTQAKAQQRALQLASQVEHQRIQEVEQGVAQEVRHVERESVAAIRQNSSIDQALDNVQKVADMMKELLHFSSTEWLLLANPMDKVLQDEAATEAVAQSALAQLEADPLTRRLAEQEAAQGALPDTPFMPSATRLVTGLTTDDYEHVLADGERVSRTRQMLCEKKIRLHAELAAIETQITTLQRLASDGSSDSAWQRLDKEAERRLQGELADLQRQAHILVSGDESSSLLEMFASRGIDSMRRSILLVYHQQSTYQLQMTRQLFDMLTQLWARCEILETLRNEERRELHDAYYVLQSICSQLERAVEAAAMDVKESTGLTAAAESDALLANDRGPAVLVGSEAMLTAAYTVLDTQQQLLQQSCSVGPPEEGVGSNMASASSLELTASSARSSAGGGGISVSGSGNAFLDSVRADPAQRTVSQLATAAEALIGLMDQLEDAVHSRVCVTTGQQLAETRKHVEDLRQMLTAPAPAGPGQPASPVGQGSGTESGSTSGHAAESWPVLRDPQFSKELAAANADHERLVGDVARLVARCNMAWDARKRQPEQHRLERTLLSLFWSHEGHLLAEMQALRQRKLAVAGER